MPTNPTDH
jgi:hypothetical protein